MAIPVQPRKVVDDQIRGAASAARAVAIVPSLRYFMFRYSLRGEAVITYNCTIQEGVIPEEQRQIMNERLVQIGAAMLGVAADDISVNYEVIPHGFGFRGGELSTSSSVRSVIPDGFSQERRVEFMQAVQDVWIEVTGQTSAELVVSAADASYRPNRD